MRIARVVVSWASQAAGSPVASLAAFEGPDAEAPVDDLLHTLVEGGPTRRASRWVHFLVTPENGDAWEFTQDFDYTYPNATVRRLVRHDAQLEQFYGDDCAKAGDYLHALCAEAPAEGVRP